MFQLRMAFKCFIFQFCFSITPVDFTFSDLITLSVCLGFDDVPFYQSLHDFLDMDRTDRGKKKGWISNN